MNLIDDDILKMPSDQMRAVLMLDDGFECKVPAREDWLGNSKIYPPDEGVVCYTDGSTKEGLSGAGFICESLNTEVYLQENGQRFYKQNSSPYLNCVILGK